MENIIVSAFGESWEMTLDQIEAAYRYQEKEYRKMDAKRMIDDRLEFWVDGDKKEFKKEYGCSYETAVGDIDYLAKDFLDNLDCNVSENELWAQVLDRYFSRFNQRK